MIFKMVIRCGHYAFEKQLEDFIVLPIGTTVFYGQDCEDGLAIEEYMIDLKSDATTVLCHLEKLTNDAPSCKIGDHEIETWGEYLTRVGFTPMD